MKSMEMAINAISGPKLIQIGTSKLPHGHVPLVFYNTLLTCQTQSGKTNQISVALYKSEDNLQGKTKAEVNDRTLFPVSSRH